jgi:2-dehydro-3-deoxyphosphogluconate aldolase/(4S)-4-hydroxy-2-oxoglutarate aldolase
MKNQILKMIGEQRLLPLYFHEDPAVSLQVLLALYNAGIRAVEYTNRGKEAMSNFKKMCALRSRELPGLYLGIGTIKNSEAARQFIDAGADFLVCPGMVEEVAIEANKSDLLWIPGCMTPSEIIHAEACGASLIKLFPGNILGASFLSAVKNLFPELYFMPTGGVELTQENISMWFNAGVYAVGVGSNLISRELLLRKDYTALEAATKQALTLMN